MRDWDKVLARITQDIRYRDWMALMADQQNFSRRPAWHKQFAFDHGVDHMIRVARTTGRLLKELYAQKDWIRLGMIAGLVHDIGFARGKVDHAQRSAWWAERFLRSLHVVSKRGLPMLLQAVANHGDGGMTPTLVGAVLAIADKADLCRQRCLFPEESPVSWIDSYQVHWCSGVLRFDYTLLDPAGRDSFYLIPKTLDVPQRLAGMFGWRVEFWINGKLDAFTDRILNGSHAHVYQRAATAEGPDV